MPFFPRTEEDIVKDSLDKLRTNSNITQLAPGGKTRFLVETVATEQADQNDLFDSNLLQVFIKYADDKFLDYFGDMLDLARYNATHASASGENFYFYVDSGSFGDLNSGGSIVIPSGAIIKTPNLIESAITPGIEEQPIVYFQTTANIVCNSGDAIAYGPITAQSEGRESSLPRNVLTDHDFKGYTQSNKKGLKCSNRYSIDNGSSRESDISYRYRLQNAFKSKAFATYASIRLAALSVPGVADVAIINCEQGPGSFALYIDSIAPTVSPELAQRVSEAVQAVTAEGIRSFVSGSRTLGLELVVAINWSSSISESDKALAYKDIRTYIESRLNIIRMGEEVEFVDLIDGIRSVTPYIATIGRRKPNEFEQVYLYKTGADGTGSVRNLHIGDRIVPLYNEKVILETGNRFRGIQFIAF